MTNSIETLLPITRTLEKGITKQSINARHLWLFVESKQKFSDWIKSRIKEGLFKKGIDFETVETLSVINLGSSNNKQSSKARRQKQKDYLLSLPMAKELAMLERNQQGKLARQFFIQCEQELQRIAPDITLQLYRQWGENRRLVKNSNVRMCEALERNRIRQGKTPNQNAFINEAEMIATIILGQNVRQWKKEHNITGCIREALNGIQLEQLEYLESADQVLLDMNMNQFQQRKNQLITLFKAKYGESMSNAAL